MVKPLAREIWPSPTMMDERIGIMGSTQGVNDSSKPNSTNSGTMTSGLPLLSAFSIFALSSSIVDLVVTRFSTATPGAPCAAVDTAVGTEVIPPDVRVPPADAIAGISFAASSSVSTFTLFAPPPKPASDTCAKLSIGG
jgi:hypothetical protein